MRIYQYPISIPSGKLWIFDPYYLFDYEVAMHTEGLIVFTDPYVRSDGNYAVLEMNGMYFVNIHPRTLRVKKFPNMTPLPKKVPVDGCSVGFIDSQHPSLGDKENEIINGVGVLIDVTPGEYHAWFEQKDRNYYRGVIGFGNKPTMILNGDYANELAALEKSVVQVVRKQGDYNTTRSQLRESMLKLQVDGCKDKHLYSLASMIGLELPRK